MNLGCDSNYQSGLPTLDLTAMVRSFGRHQSEAEAALKKLLITKRLYAPQLQPLRAMVEAIRAGLPIMLEGLPGCGKTALVQNTAYAANMPMFKLACHPGIDNAALAYSWNEHLQKAFIETSIQRGGEPDAILAEAYSKKFLNLGTILKAFEAMRTHRSVVVLVDETDKLSAKHADTLLEPFSEFRMNVDRLLPESTIGIPDPDRRPVVAFTSNDMYEGVSSALKKRCLYVYFKPPTRDERAVIYSLQSTGCSQSLLLQAFIVLEFIETECRTLIEKPGIRNGIWWLQSLVSKGVTEITPEEFERSISYLVTREDDQYQLLKKAHFIIQQIERRAGAYRPVVGKAIEQRDHLVEQAARYQGEIDQMFEAFGYLPGGGAGFDPSIPEHCDRRETTVDVSEAVDADFFSGLEIEALLNTL